MNSFNPAEDYVSPHHMMSFVGLESSSCSNSGSQRQQLWDWEVTTSTTAQAPTTALHQASLFPGAVSHSSFYDCAAPAGIPAMAAGSGGGYHPYHTAVGGGYPVGLIKSEEDRGGAGAGQNIGLNLGHRTYFPSGDAVAVDQLFRRARGIYQVSQQAPRCQAEGCKADLSGAKHYHRRHKVCELHSKATMVVAGGMQQRFCQQCSRFHPLSEFDECKRSCRRRLAEHNRRRRKSNAHPTASTTASDGSTPPDTSTASTEKSKNSPPKPISSPATKEIITTTGTPTSTNSQANTNLESPKDYQKIATHLRNGPSLSLGGAGGADKGGFGFQYHQQMRWVVMSDENNSSRQQQQQQQQQQRISSSSSSSGIFFQSQNFFCGSANEATQSTTGDHQDNPLQLGQGMLEVDFI